MLNALVSKSGMPNGCTQVFFFKPWFEVTVCLCNVVMAAILIYIGNFIYTTCKLITITMFIHIVS